MASGKLIDLDEEGGIIEAQLYDDIRNPCRQLVCQFRSSNQLLFTNDSSNYFTFAATNWVPMSLQEVNNKDGFTYIVKALPTKAIDSITSTISNSSELADALGCARPDSFQNLSFSIGFKNFSPATIVNRIKADSMETNYSDFNKAWFLYFDSSSLISTTYDSILTAKSQVIQFDSNTPPQTSYWDTRLLSQYEVETKPAKQSYIDKMNLHIGRSISMQTNASNRFLSMYTFSQSDFHSELPAMLCGRVITDSTKYPAGYKISFFEMI